MFSLFCIFGDNEQCQSSFQHVRIYRFWSPSLLFVKESSRRLDICAYMQHFGVRSKKKAVKDDQDLHSQTIKRGHSQLDDPILSAWTKPSSTRLWSTSFTDCETWQGICRVTSQSKAWVKRDSPMPFIFGPSFSSSLSYGSNFVDASGPEKAWCLPERSLSAC